MNRKQRRAEKAQGKPAMSATPPRIQALFAEAHRDHQLGRLTEAERLYRQVLAVDPGHADSLHLLGVVAHQLGRNDVAVGLIGQAIACNRAQPAYHLNLGMALKALGKLDAAAASYSQALALKPDYAEAHSNLGNVQRGQGELAAAVISYNRALAHKPDLAEVHFNLGRALQDQAKPAAAGASYARALALRPNHVEAHSNLGNALKDQGRLEEALASYDRALVLEPDHAPAHYNRGVVLKEQGKLGEAIAAYERASAIKPDYAEAHYNLGATLQERGDRGDLAAAVASYGRATAVDPAFAAAHYNLGLALREQGAVQAAIASYERALVHQPALVAALTNLLLDQHYLTTASNQTLLAAARRFGERFGPPPPTDVSNDRTPDRRLRIGYVSADFRNHPVGYFLDRVLPAHDRAAIELFGYSNSAIADAMTDRLRAACDQWRSIVDLSDDAARALIRRDGIDILVDLAGHTGNNRLALFATRAAPVQVSWLGYFGTTGLSTMDYVIADPVVVPPGEDAYFTETVWRLPDHYLCLAPPDIDVAVEEWSPPDADALMLGCFNNWIKISPETIGLWAEILAKLPGAQLFLKTKGLDDPEIQRTAIARFAVHGIGPERLLLEGHTPRADYLAAYNRVDIALDPIPFGGGTTTAEALWMGVPVVTVRGTRWVGRMSESILRAAGLAELVADDRAGYVQRVVELAVDTERLGRLRRGLRSMVEGSALCDGARFTRSLEAAYRGMWRVWCAGSATRGFGDARDVE